MRRALFIPAAVLVSCGWAFGEPQAADDGERAREEALEVFRRLDANGDGKVTADEVPADRRALFERLLRRGDADKDGALAAGEFIEAMAARPRLLEEARRRPQAPERPRRAPGTVPERPRPEPQPVPGPAPMSLFALLDLDRDGKLSAEELARAPELIARFDRDGDGALSAREVMRALGQPEGASRPPAAPEPGAPARPLANLFRQLDKDGDGKISREEANPRLAKRFAELDLDGDGKLDKSELMRLFVEEKPKAADGDQKRKAEGGKKPAEKKAKEPVEL